MLARRHQVVKCGGERLAIGDGGKAGLVWADINGGLAIDLGFAECWVSFNKLVGIGKTQDASVIDFVASGDAR